MIYQLIDEFQIKSFPNYIEADGKIYTNAIAEEKALKSSEWFTLESDEIPEYDPETQYLVQHYKQLDNYIYQYWNTENKIINENANDIDILNAFAELGADIYDEGNA